MKCKIYYTSSRGVAEAIAYAISEVAGVNPERLNPAFMPDRVDLMFLGCDGSHTDEVVLDFIATLKPERVQCAAIFNTNSKMSDRALERMRSALEERKITVLENTLLCLSHPFKKELQGFDRVAAVDFAHAALREVSQHQQLKRGS